MARTAVATIDQLLRDSINLDPDVVAIARRSRDWLLEQIRSWPDKESDFPPLHHAVNQHFGSFARRTKIRELDDIDLMIGLNAQGTTYSTEPNGSVRLTVPAGVALRKLCHDGTDLLNSRRVVNVFVERLKDVPQYQSAEIKRNQEAAVLKLSSYDWSYDIVPSFITNEEWDRRTYYVIPDGSGHWKKTDPRIDRKRVEDINSQHQGHLWNVIRLVKFWNQRRSVRTIPSYLLECLVLGLYENQLLAASDRPEREIPRVLNHIALFILFPVLDPKGIQGDINTCTAEERNEIAAKASEHARWAAAALEAQAQGNERDAILHWREVFGTDLPAYG